MSWSTAWYNVVSRYLASSNSSTRFFTLVAFAEGSHLAVLAGAGFLGNRFGGRLSISVFSLPAVAACNSILVLNFCLSGVVFGRVLCLLFMLKLPSAAAAPGLYASTAFGLRRADPAETPLLACQSRFREIPNVSQI
ncbi:hypothetical protein BaRGS_00024401 [Batillaria attramentaria]|uniref:Uncharacterized protein n=1 Tax=Batillaria attramentaria TaxID=370345 RepID=A0ABD0KBB8_9CAEN